MTATGYDAARTKSETVARILRDVALLVGEPSGERLALETGGAVVPGLGFREDAASLSIRARDLSQGLFKIIVLGEFKNGKSTLLNGMLGSKTLPAKAAPSTAIITVLVHGYEERVAIYESGRSEPRMVRWEQFVSEFQLSRDDQETLQEHGTVDRFRHIEYAQIECAYPICASGVKLIDSPGLGEHVSRTRVATNFLKQAQAVIFVLSATRILGRDEREFIDNVLGSSQLNHVFFVVNRINQVDEADVEDIHRWVKEGLRHHFLDESGQFNEDLYGRRVFFVNAKGALDVASVRPLDEDRLERTGVPALEREIERFLATEDKIEAALQSTVQVLGPIVEQAHRRIGQQKAALDQPLDELERRHAEAERQLTELESRKGEIERTILLFSGMVKRKVYASLRASIEEMHDTWPEDSHRLIDLDSAMSIKNILASYAQREARERMSEAISAQVQRYLQIKFSAWADRVPQLIAPDVESMIAEVEAQVDDFQLELDGIASVFAGTPTGKDAGRAAGPRLLHLAMTLGEISGLTDTVMDSGDWAAIIGRMAQQAVLVLLVSTFVTGGNFLIALLIVEAVQLGLHENEIKKRIRIGLGDRLYESLQQQVTEKQAFVHDAVEGRFREFAEALTSVVQQQIDDVRSEQDRIVRQKRDEHFSVDGEKARLDTIGERLSSLYRALGDVTLDRNAETAGV